MNKKLIDKCLYDTDIHDYEDIDYNCVIYDLIDEKRRLNEFIAKSQTQ